MDWWYSSESIQCYGIIEIFKYCLLLLSKWISFKSSLSLISAIAADDDNGMHIYQSKVQAQKFVKEMDHV